MERILSEIKFTCMGTYMSLQQPRTGETFSTKWTLASLVMSSNVHRIGGHRDVSFLTMRTFPRLLVLQRPVKQSTNQGNVCVWPGKKCTCSRYPGIPALGSSVIVEHWASSRIFKLFIVISNNLNISPMIPMLEFQDTLS